MEGAAGFITLAIVVATLWFAWVVAGKVVNADTSKYDAEYCSTLRGLDIESGIPLYMDNAFQPGGMCYE